MTDGDQTPEEVARGVKANAIASTLIHLMVENRLKEDWEITTESIEEIAGEDTATLVVERMSKVLDIAEEYDDA